MPARTGAAPASSPAATAGVNIHMVRHIHRRRAFVAAALTTALFVAGTPATASAGQTVPKKVCGYDWTRGTWHIRQLIKCAAERWGSPGTPKQAVAIADCESQLEPDAHNPNGYAGLFQQAVRYWPGRADRWGQPNRSVYNARANVIVSIRMASAAGSWNAWGGCG
ncbi:MAG TPA: hypothetical protein VLA90_06660 [Actinomycetota bacterium]|nr:hypothetical protein [Actinomycetota bacterium]